MQFQVIVEGNGGAIATPDSWDELERYLRAANIPPALIRELQPGKPRVVKKQLSYSQAVSLSDRLADWGLDSSIEPPLKAEPKAKAPLRRPAKAAPVEIPTKPKPSKTTKAKPPSPSTAKPGIEEQAARQVQSLLRKLPSKFDLGIAAEDPRRWLMCCKALALPLLFLSAFGGALVAAATCLLLLHSLLATKASLLATLLLIPALGLVAISTMFLRLLWPERPEEPPTVSLSEQADPRLSMLVAAVCRSLQVPAPQVVLAPEAQLRMHWRGEDRRAVLQLGAPVLAALNIRELVACIAGECAKLSQARQAPYRLLSRAQSLLCAYHRPERLAKRLMDHQPAAKSELILGMWAVLQRLVAAMDGFVRACSARSSTRIDSVLNREPLCAKHQQAVLGEAPTALRKKLIAVQDHYAQALTGTLFPNDEHLLLDNLAGVAAALASENESLRENPQALVSSQQPAQLLLKNFARLDQQLTRIAYQQAGYDLETLQLLPLPEFKRREANGLKLRKVASEFYGRWFHPRQFWLLPGLEQLDPRQQQAIVQRLNHCIAKIRYFSPDRSQQLLSWERLTRQVNEMECALLLRAAEVDYQLTQSHTSPQDWQRALQTQRRALEEVSDELRQQNRLMGERLALCFALEGQYPGTVSKLRQALTCFQNQAAKILRLERDAEQLKVLLSNEPKQPMQNYQSQVRQLQEELTTLYRSISRQLQDCPYDFYDRRYQSIGEVLAFRLQQADRQAGTLKILDKVEIVLTTLQQTYEHSSQIAAVYAARVEKKFGVEAVRRL